MSIVPQIALVKPNREVRQFVEPSPEAIRDAISESNGSGQLTLQKGVYGAENRGQNINVPLGIDVIVMPGADVSQVNFFDPDGNPFPNIFDFNNLGNIAKVVNTISTGDGIQVDQNTGDVTVSIPQNGIVTNLIADGAVTPAKLETNTTPSQGEVLAYNGSVMTWDDPDVETSNPISGTGLSGSPISLKFKNTASVSLGVNNGQLIAQVRDDGITDSMMSENSVNGEAIDASGFPPSNSQFLGWNSGLKWEDVSASDVTGGSFSGTYTFNNQLTLSNGASLNGSLEMAGGADIDFSAGSDNGSIEFSSGDIIVASDRDVTLDAGNTNSSDVVINAGNNLEIDTSSVKVDTGELQLETDDGNMENVSNSVIAINSSGYMDFPMWDNNNIGVPATPPDGYVRIYAKTGDSGNSKGKFEFREPSGATATLAISN